jgi:hypothetical protein
LVAQIAHPVEIRAARESDAELIRDTVKAIAAEKRYLATVNGFSLEETRAFLKQIVDRDWPQATEFAGGLVVGFCDILPNATVGFGREGVKARGRKFDARYQDVILMALWM